MKNQKSKSDDFIIIDDIAGTRLHAGAGNDTVWTAGGADIVLGGRGDDVIGDAWMDRAPSNDIYRGNRGNDTLVSFAGNDKLFGGAGRDEFHYLLGDDITVSGGRGKDVLYISVGDDIWGLFLDGDFEKVRVKDVHGQRYTWVGENGETVHMTGIEKVFLVYDSDY